MVEWKVDFSRLGGVLVGVVNDDAAEEVTLRLGDAVQQKTTGRSDSSAVWRTEVSSGRNSRKLGSDTH